MAVLGLVKIGTFSLDTYEPFSEITKRMRQRKMLWYLLYVQIFEQILQCQKYPIHAKTLKIGTLSKIGDWRFSGSHPPPILERVDCTLLYGRISFLLVN